MAAAGEGAARQPRNPGCVRRSGRRESCRLAAASASELLFAEPEQMIGHGRSPFEDRESLSASRRNGINGSGAWGEGQGEGVSGSAPNGSKPSPGCQRADIRPLSEFRER